MATPAQIRVANARMNAFFANEVDVMVCSCGNSIGLQTD